MTESLSTLLRISYFFTCMASLCFAAGMGTLAYFGARNANDELDGQALALVALVLLVYGAPSVRALWRLLRRTGFLPRNSLDQHRVTAMWVTAASLGGNVLLAVAFLRVVHADPALGGEVATLLIGVVTLFSFVLLTGECVIMRRRRLVA